MSFIMLRYASSTPTLLSVFIINGCCTLSNAFSTFIDMSCDFCLSFFYVIYYICWFVNIVTSPTIRVLLFICSFKSSEIFLIYSGVPLWDAYIFIMCMSSWWILRFSIMKYLSVSLYMAFHLKSILSDIGIITLAFFPVNLLGIYFWTLHFQFV